MISSYNISPVEIKRGETVIATCDRIDLAYDYAFNATSMDVYYTVLDLSAGYVGWEGNVHFDAANLAQWGTDDSYIINQVVAAAGVTLS